MDNNTHSKVVIAPIQEEDRSWITQLLNQQWGSAKVVSRGKVHQADQLPGFIARHMGKPSGLITYQVQGAQGEIVTLNSLKEGLGIATALIESVKEVMKRADVKRLWLITTNDNTPALTYYQKRGFRIAAIHNEAIAISRKLKPEIPELGHANIPIRDEIELEIKL
jgi:GNAT superfamily N-acetyltransferase